MAVQGRVRENKTFEKRVGLFEANVRAINPSREELEKLLGIPELEKDPEYLKEDEEGTQKLSLSIWLEDVLSKQLFNLRISLKDAYRENKDKTKFQYINSAGASSWADDPENLPSWFLEGGREYRKAHIGEEEMYNFLRNYLNKLDIRNDPDATLDIDWKKLMRGNVKELVDLGNTPYKDTVVALATVRTDDKSGEPIDYQQVYNRDFLPGNTMKFFKLNGSKKPKFVQKFIDRIEDPEYGCKEFYGLSLGVLATYNPEENIARSDDSIPTEDGPDL